MLSPSQQDQAQAGTSTGGPSTSSGASGGASTAGGEVVVDELTSAEREIKTNAAFMKVSFERYLSQIVSAAEREAHQERLRKINEVARNLHKDEWMFTPIEKLLGNSSQ